MTLGNERDHGSMPDGAARLDAALAGLAAAERRLRPTPSARLAARVLADAAREAPVSQTAVSQVSVSRRSHRRGARRRRTIGTTETAAFALSLVVGLLLGLGNVMPTRVDVGAGVAEVLDLGAETEIAGGGLFGNDAPF